MTANNDDGLRLGRETQHVSVQHERTGLHNEQARVRRGTVYMPREGEHQFLGVVCHNYPYLNGMSSLIT